MIEAQLYQGGHLVPGINATAWFDIQDNSTCLTDWVIPNDWTIAVMGEGESKVVRLTTPTPVAGAVGPQIEGTGRDYNQYNNGDAFTTGTYKHGFQLRIDYEYTTAYVQPDNPNHDEREDNKDERKVSFVANSGVKIGSLNDAKRYEIAIIDLETWLALTNGLDQLEIYNTDWINLNNQRDKRSYKHEEVNRLLPGMLYKGEYKSGSGTNARGLTDAHDIFGSLTPADYKTLLARTLNCWDTGSMIIVADPAATDGRLKVYMRLKEGATHTGHSHTDIYHPVHHDYYLFYRTDTQRADHGGDEITFNANTRIHLQSHWGSGVTFTKVDITPL
jgi:hypothetical protein